MRISFSVPRYFDALLNAFKPSSLSLSFIFYFPFRLALSKFVRGTTSDAWTFHGGFPRCIAREKRSRISPAILAKLLLPITDPPRVDRRMTVATVRRNASRLGIASNRGPSCRILVQVRLKKCDAACILFRVSISTLNTRFFAFDRALRLSRWSNYERNINSIVSALGDGDYWFCICASDVIGEAELLEHQRSRWFMENTVTGSLIICFGIGIFVTPWLLRV